MLANKTNPIESATTPILISTSSLISGGKRIAVRAEPIF